MTLKEHFEDLFIYSRHYNQKFINLLETLPAEEKSIKLISHIVNAHQIWNRRINYQAMGTGVWDIRSMNELRAADEQNFEETLQILKTLDLEKIIDYKNIKGEPFSNPVREILFHVVNHSTYHRAQISAALKAGGTEPIISDYIFYKREK